MRKQALLLLALGMAISSSACTGGNSGSPSVSVSVSPRVELGIEYASPGGVPLRLDAYLPFRLRRSATSRRRIYTAVV